MTARNGRSPAWIAFITASSRVYHNSPALRVSHTVIYPSSAQYGKVNSKSPPYHI